MNFDIHLALSVSNLAVLLGILWKGSRLVNQVEMMWRVFAADHGLDPTAKKQS